MRAALLAAALSLAPPAQALREEVGVNAAEFLRVGAGARALGMGEAYGPVAEGPEALYWNPAGLAQARRPELSYTRSQMLRFLHHDYLAYAQPGVFGGALGASLTRLAQDSLPVVSNANQELGRFTPDSFAFSIGYGRSLTLTDFRSGSRDYFRDSWFVPGAHRPMMDDRELWVGTLMLGGALKVVHERVHLRSASAFAVDGGAIFRPEESPQWSLSFAFRNAGGKQHFGTGSGHSQALPAEVALGAAYDKRGWKTRLVPALEIAVPYNGNPYGKLGLEYSWPAAEGVQVSLRAGYKSQSAPDLGALSGLTAGAGARWRRAGADFAFQPLGALGQVYRLTLGWKF